MKYLIFVSLILLTGCTHFTGPTGRDAYNVDCNILKDCFKEADNLCPYGYAALDHETNYFIGSNNTIMVECDSEPKELMVD